jgi:fructokinase
VRWTCSCRKTEREKALTKIVTLGEVVSDIYRGEESSEVELGFVARPGGAPANVAVAASRLGAEAAFVGSVGEDLLGDFILRALESEGVETGGVSRQKPPTRTSLAFVEITDDGNREFTFYRSSPAADELLSPDDVTEDLVAGASFVNFGSIPLIREPVRSATHRIAELAQRLDVPIAFDVNFREHLWESIEAAREAVDFLLDFSTIVKLGDDELSPLLGTEAVEEAAGMLLDRGVPLVLISRGSEGALYATREFSGDVPPFDVDEVVDATGAGDAFLAAALVHLSGEAFDEERLREATRRGCAAGALACTDYGAMRALPTMDELERFMAGQAAG